MNKITSWGNVADWYDNLIKKNSYQKKLILPNPIRLAEIKRGEIIVDLAPPFKLNEAYKTSKNQIVNVYEQIRTSFYFQKIARRRIT